jgi:hypothetical protein
MRVRVQNIIYGELGVLWTRDENKGALRTRSDEEVQK